MAVYGFICLDCSESFEVDSRQPVEGPRVRCSHCDSAHIRQTFESYLRNALDTRHRRSLDELRGCHFG
jgi:DNA-directed RNA polymerase subunit RPC12/RpoP